MKKQVQIVDNRSEKILNNFIDYSVAKEGCLTTIDRLKKFIVGDNNAITRENNFRDDFKQIGAAIIAEILDYNPGLYVSKRVKPKTEYNIDTYKIFIDACIATLTIHGPDQLYMALNEAKKGNFNGITNDGDHHYRDTLKNTINASTIKSFINVYLKDNNYTIPEGTDITSLFVDSIQDLVIQNNNNKLNNM